MVGAAGFEPVTSASRTQRSTKLSYAPISQRSADHSNPQAILASDGEERLLHAGNACEVLVCPPREIPVTAHVLRYRRLRPRRLDSREASARRIPRNHRRRRKSGAFNASAVASRDTSCWAPASTPTCSSAPGSSSADGFVAVTDGDNRNVMAALIAKRMFHVKKIVARIYDPPRGQLYRELGIETVCPTTIGAKIVRDSLHRTCPFASTALVRFRQALARSRSTVDRRQAGTRVSRSSSRRAHPHRRRSAAAARPSSSHPTTSSRPATKSTRSSRPKRSREFAAPLRIERRCRSK